MFASAYPLAASAAVSVLRARRMLRLVSNASRPQTRPHGGASHCPIVRARRIVALVLCARNLRLRWLMSDATCAETTVAGTQQWEETPDLFSAPPRLTEGQIATLLPGGTRRPVRVDEIKIREGTRSQVLFLILLGKVAIVT